METNISKLYLQENKKVNRNNLLSSVQIASIFYFLWLTICYYLCNYYLTSLYDNNYEYFNMTFFTIIVSLGFGMVSISYLWYVLSYNNGEFVSLLKSGKWKVLVSFSVLIITFIILILYSYPDLIKWEKNLYSNNWYFSEHRSEELNHNSALVDISFFLYLSYACFSIIALNYFFKGGKKRDKFPSTKFDYLELGIMFFTYCCIMQWNIMLFFYFIPLFCGSIFYMTNVLSPDSSTLYRRIYNTIYIILLLSSTVLVAYITGLYNGSLGNLDLPVLCIYFIQLIYKYFLVRVGVVLLIGVMWWLYLLRAKNKKNFDYFNAFSVSLAIAILGFIFFNLLLLHFE